MYIEALKNSGFKEEFTYLRPKSIKPNNDGGGGTADNCNIKGKCHKIEKGK